MCLLTWLIALAQVVKFGIGISSFWMVCVGLGEQDMSYRLLEGTELRLSIRVQFGGV